MMIKKQIITNSLVKTHNKLAESPVWSIKEHALYWTDIEEKQIFRYDPQTKQLVSFELPCKVGSMGLIEDGGMVLAVEDGFALWDGKSRTFEMIHQTIPDQSPCMMNDGKVDPMGRFWAGSKGPKGLANLWFLEKQNKVQKVLAGLGISNGLDWDSKTFYFTDSLDARIYRYDYDSFSGQIQNPSVFFESPIGVPDGLTLDSQGNLWTAIWDGWKVLQLSPASEILQEIELPVQRPSSVCFGGGSLRTLFITSASVDLSDDELAKQSLAGDIFSFESEIPGKPCSYYLR